MVHCHYPRIFPAPRTNQQPSCHKPVFSPLHRHDPLFRVIWVPQFHKASFCPDVNLSKCVTWDLYVVFKVTTGAQILQLSSFLHVFLHVLGVWVRDRLKVITVQGGSYDLVLSSFLQSFNLSKTSLSRKKVEMTQLKQEVLQGDQ